jgi:hypothetical protein
MKTIKIITIFISGLIIMLLSSKLIDIYLYPTKYIDIFQISNYADSWTRTSLLIFKIGFYINIALFYLIFVVSFISLAKDNKLYNRISIGMFIFVLLWILYHLGMYFAGKYDFVIDFSLLL